jgi:adenine-specific DNA-methyltransferase
MPDLSPQQQQKIEEALSVLQALGMPRAQQNERSALTLLALLNLTADKSWTAIERPLMGVTPIMDWIRAHYAKDYAPNTRETIRRQTLHQFYDAGLVLYNPDRPDRPVNSPKACYQVAPLLFDLLKRFGSQSWEELLKTYLAEYRTLIERYARPREMEMIPLVITDEGAMTHISLSPGAHSVLIKQIIEEFGPRFTPGAEVIYVGDTGSKAGFFKNMRLAELGVTVDDHGKMPDVVLYFPDKDWLILAESVTSHGPVDGKRHGELAELFREAKPGLVYLTAFPDRATMRIYLADISWESEVWVASDPTHLIHFDGKRFLGPY